MLTLIPAQIEKPFKVLIYKNDEGYSRNRAVGINYLNRFLIEEDNQFECAAVLDCTNDPNDLIRENLQKRLEQISNESNSDFIGHLVLFYDSEFSFVDEILPRVPDFPVIITYIGSEKQECVPKERYRKFYDEGGQIEYPNPYRPNDLESITVYESFGDDIEELYEHFKMNNITLKERRSLTRWFSLGYRHFDLQSDFVIQSESTVKTFHLSILSDHEEKKMYRSFLASPSIYEISEDYNRVNSEDYFGENFQEHSNKSSGLYYEEHSEHFGGRFENFKNVTAVSKKETNYALSLCARKTFFYTYKMGHMNAFLLEY